jgi:hypothetical protein
MGCRNSIVEMVNVNGGLIKNKNSQTNINNCKFKKIFIFKDFEVKNNILGLERDCYLSIIKILISSILRKV